METKDGFSILCSLLIIHPLFLSRDGHSLLHIFETVPHHQEVSILYFYFLISFTSYFTS